ncbi:MAG: L-threonine aldolase [Idiomarinaceae bacterium HL-53]|nr:MAG: L-threonine aldolase [Idiomarinaceae bacterium HL-53]CUS49333.1 L-threonine aldolase [Idiomarinaceae bacterium HL-53]
MGTSMQRRTLYSELTSLAQTSMLRQPSRSVKDTLTRLAAFTPSETRSDVYGQGQLISEFEQQVARIFGKPAACFMPSGTLAQNIALRIYAEQRGIPQFACHPTSHLLLHEQAAYEHLWQLEALPIGRKERPIIKADLETLDAKTLCAVVTELPAREIGGQLPDWQDLQAQSQTLRQHHIPFHFDGARLWQTQAAYQKPFTEIGALADSIYLSFYKDLAGVSGAILLGEEWFISEARVWLRRAGGNLYAWYPYILSAQLGLEENLEAVHEAVAYAKTLGPALASLESVEIIPNPPQAAMFHLAIELPEARLLSAMIEAYEQSQMQVLPLPRAQHGHSLIFEIPVGRAAMQKPVSFWVEHLAKILHLAQR